MINKYKKILIITCAINVSFFVYYLVNSDINPSVDTFYYLAVADSFYNGTGLLDITTVPPQPIYTPQNGIVFIHVLLQSLGLHGAEARLIAIKIINYFGFLLLIYIFYKIFRQLKVSPELTCLSIGILLSGAHFFKTINQPLNEGIWCVMTSIVLYLAISNENKPHYLKIAAIALSGIVLANFRLNGPIIILSLALTYYFLRNFGKALLYIFIMIFSYLSIYIILLLLNADWRGFKAFGTVYSLNFMLNHPLMTLIYTVPGAFLGFTGSSYMNIFFTPIKDSFYIIGKWIIMLPFSLTIILFYGLYLKRYIKIKSFLHVLIGSYLISLLVVLQIMPGGDSRYIIMIVPFTLLALTTYFNDSKNLRSSLGIFLLLTILISMFRLVYWDSIYFINNRSCTNIKNKIIEPYMLISESPRWSYFIFGKASHGVQDISSDTKNIVVFGRNKYDKDIIKNIQNKLEIDHIEYLNDEIITGHGLDEICSTIKIISK